MVKMWRLIWVVMLALLLVMTANAQSVTGSLVTVTPSAVAESPPEGLGTIAETVGAVANNALNVGLLIVLGVAVVALVTIGLYALMLLRDSIPAELHGLIYEAGKFAVNTGERALNDLGRYAEKTETKGDDALIARLLEEVAQLRKEFEAYKPRETL